jgi:hypothetical protein
MGAVPGHRNRLGGLQWYVEIFNARDDWVSAEQRLLHKIIGGLIEGNKSNDKESEQGLTIDAGKLTEHVIPSIRPSAVCWNDLTGHIFGSCLVTLPKEIEPEAAIKTPEIWRLVQSRDGGGDRPLKRYDTVIIESYDGSKAIRAIVRGRPLMRSISQKSRRSRWTRLATRTATFP